MPPKKDQDSTVVLVWSDGMIAIFLQLLEEQHDLGKRSDTGFKPEAWNIFREGIQSEYTGTGYIKIEKIRSKLDYWKARWNGWWWVGRQSGVGWDKDLFVWTASDETWEIIFEKKPKLRWIRTGPMEHIVLFNKIFNGRGAIGREAQTVATMLARDHFHLNATFEDYGIEDMTSENDSEMERHQAARKAEGPQFIIPPGYIPLETTTTSVPLNDANTRPPPSGQPRSRTASKSGRNTSRKRRTIVESDDDMMDEPVNKRKVKKLTGGEQIAAEMSKWSSQNAASLEARRVEIMKPEAKVLADMKIWYSAAFDDFTLAQFSALIHALKASHDDYGGSTAAEYYEMLGIGTLRDKFVEAFFEKLE